MRATGDGIVRLHLDEPRPGRGWRRSPPRTCPTGPWCGARTSEQLDGVDRSTRRSISRTRRATPTRRRRRRLDRHADCQLQAADPAVGERRRSSRSQREATGHAAGRQGHDRQRERDEGHRDRHAREAQRAQARRSRSKGRFTIRVALSSALRRKGTNTADRAARHGQGDEAAARTQLTGLQTGRPSMRRRASRRGRDGRGEAALQGGGDSDLGAVFKAPAVEAVDAARGVAPRPRDGALAAAGAGDDDAGALGGLDVVGDDADAAADDAVADRGVGEEARRAAGADGGAATEVQRSAVSRTPSPSVSAGGGGGGGGVRWSELRGTTRRRRSAWWCCSRRTVVAHSSAPTRATTRARPGAVSTAVGEDASCVPSKRFQVFSASERWESVPS